VSNYPSFGRGWLLYLAGEIRLNKMWSMVGSAQQTK
jgi:hypothetical protein